MIDKLIIFSYDLLIIWVLILIVIILIILEIIIMKESRQITSLMKQMFPISISRPS